MVLSMALLLLPLISIMLYRIACEGGLIEGRRNRFNRVIWQNEFEKVGLREIAKIAFYALMFRLFIYLISYFLMLLVYNNDGTLLEWWTKWDAEAYINITTGSYSQGRVDNIPGLGNGVMNTLVFLPMYPLMAAGVNVFIGNVQIALLVTSTICYVAACVVLFMAVNCRYRKCVAEKSVILLSISPFAFYQGAMLPESAFILFSALTVYFTFRRKWWLAGLMGVLLALTRLQGIIIIAFVGLEWLQDKNLFYLIKNKFWGKFGKALLTLPAVFMPFIGLGIYMLVNMYYTNDPFYFMKLQKMVWAHKYVHIPEAMSNLLENLIMEQELAVKFSVWLPEILIFVLVIVLLFYTLGKHAISLSVYVIIYMIISYSSDYVVSATRYMSVAVMLFIILGEVCARRPAIYKSLVASGLMLQVIYMACHLSGWHLVT